MALNWYLTLKNLSKTNVRAAELFDLLQKAQTDEEKETAKLQAQEYIKAIQEAQDSDSEPAQDTIPQATEEKPVEEDLGSDTGCNPVDTVDNPVLDNDTADEDREPKDEEEKPKELTMLALNPRLSKYGITREEELFLQGVYLRNMTREEKILMRRSIYQKQTEKERKIQADYRQKRIEQRQKDLNDPEKIRYNQERKYITAVIDARRAHKNFVYIFSKIDGLTPEILKELLKKEENKSAILQQDPDFMKNFIKGYGV